MKIMYIDPKGNPEFNHLFGEMARECKDPDTLVTVTGLNGSVGAMDNLEYRIYEALVVGDTVKAARQAGIEGYDAVVIGCFYDPAIEEVRQIAGRHSMIAVAPCEASIRTALRLGNSFSIVIGQWLWKDQMMANVRRYGHANQLASFRAIDMSVPGMEADRDEAKRRIIEQAEAAVQEDKAETVILGCTMQHGFYREVQEAVGVPVIDPAVAALKTAEFGASLKGRFGWTTSTAWGMEAPPEETLRRFKILQQPYEFSDRFDVV